MKLRRSLFQLVVGIVVPLVVLAGVLGFLLVEHEKETFRDGALARNRAFMTAVDAEIRGHLSTLTALGAAESLASNDLRRFYGDALRVRRSQRDWQNVILSFPSGQQVINAMRPFGTPLPANADIESTRRVAQTLAPVVGDVRLGRLTKKYGVPLRVPVMQNGRLAYILTAVIEPETFGNLIRAQNLPAAWVSGLTDSSGHFIARIPPRSPADTASKDFREAVAASSEGWYRGLTVEGQETFTAHKTSALTHWSVGLAIPTAEVYAAAYNAAWILGLGTLATLTLAIGFAYWMGRRIADPIGSLASLARSIGENKIPADWNTDAGIREVREVALALKEASQAIRERQALIEREQTALKAADRAKDEFLAMLGHELRNPLGAITTSAYVLRKAKPGEPAVLRAQAVIERQTKHMTRLIEDLLDISRLAMGKVTLRKEGFDLSRLAHGVVRTWEESAKRGSPRPIALEAAAVWVDADRARIEQILSNLLDNADKFSPAGKTVRVRVSQEGEQAVLEVSDEGEGIAPEMLDQVFALFVQGPRGPDRARGGMGVGLALVRRIAEMHGGTVAAASKGLGKGATFTVRLPVAAKPNQEKHASTDAATCRQARRVLVIEDNEDAREMMLAMLTLDGHSARALSNGEAALLEAEKWNPDIVLVDIGLPDIDGYEVARRIRATRLNGVKLVAVTGYGQAEDERRAQEAGFDLHLTKPVSPELLRHVLSALMPKEPLH